MVAERVVDVLEPVEVEQQQPERCTGPLALRRGLEPVGEQRRLGRPVRASCSACWAVLVGLSVQATARAVHLPEQQQPHGEQAGDDQARDAGGRGGDLRLGLLVRDGDPLRL